MHAEGTGVFIPIKSKPRRYYGQRSATIGASKARCGAKCVEKCRSGSIAPGKTRIREVFCKQRCAEYMGLTRDAVLSEGWKGAIHPDDVERLLQQRNRARDSGIRYDMEHRLRGAEGGYRWFLSRSCGFPPRTNISGASTNCSSNPGAHDFSRPALRPPEIQRTN